MVHVSSDNAVCDSRAAPASQSSFEILPRDSATIASATAHDLRDALSRESYDVIDELLNPRPRGSRGQNSSSKSNLPDSDRHTTQAPLHLPSKKKPMEERASLATSQPVTAVAREHSRRRRIWRSITIVFLAMCAGGTVAFWLFAPHFAEQRLARKELRKTQPPTPATRANNGPDESNIPPIIPHQVARVPLPEYGPPSQGQEPVAELASALTMSQVIPEPDTTLVPELHAGDSAPEIPDSAVVARDSWRRPSDLLRQKLQQLSATTVESEAALPLKLKVDWKTVPKREYRPATRLAQRIEAIERGPEPLGAFLRFASQFTAAPITVRPEALRLSAISLETPVQVRLSHGTMGEVLGTPLHQLHLQYRIQDSDIVIFHPSSQLDEEKSCEPTLNLLVARGLDPAAVLHAIGMPVGSADGVPDPNNAGKRSAALRGSRLQVLEAEEILARIHAAVGGSVDPSTQTAAHPFAHRALLAEAMLDRPVFLTGSKHKPLAGLFLELEKQTKGYFLVDWPALRAEGLSEHTPVRTEGERMPLRTFLEHFLASRKLAYRVEANATVQITTRERELQQMDLELYWMAGLHQEGVDAEIPQTPILWDEILSRMTPVFSHAGIPVPAREAFHPVDAFGVCWVARLPQSVHRHCARAIYTNATLRDSAEARAIPRFERFRQAGISR